ncbi:CRISPR-associated helicase Cas3' [Thiohalophilus sp.]|uniref:type I-G CRISPR-associated helicase/endonuclease Cas3g n=1 Tax=Thiohalophilus sp. TaxID=3028392 RepID=UPI002ACDB3A5|nr:CRISPR-associated helicase Cas3' [Thiohalophilus sp.]MDZ7662596.1 CRISPR-associated helicase Cas3' [Thiohalophilus sp.]
MEFDDFFRKATGISSEPYPYQNRLANEPWPELLNVPTGMGKTAAATLAWVYKRKIKHNSDTPRRLIWCLPMRVLVEQTQSSIETWLSNLGLLGEAGEHGKISVHVLMGGSEAVTKAQWAEHPEADMILIGTQDMLLSRALMRGYGMSRYQWPMHFALLHNDALWVFDEVQLMGAGISTSAQLEAFRRTFPIASGSHSLWLSATLNPDWLTTVDLKPHIPSFNSLMIGDMDREQAGDRLDAIKKVKKAPFILDKSAGNKTGLDAYLKALCDAVLENHDESTQTLVIVNRVERAQGLFRLIRERRPQSRDMLIHARFRSAEREAKNRCLLNEPGTDRIIVATQAIEAGVDVSSKILFTELAPWSSLAQRFGRCNRYGEHNTTGGANIIWIDIEDDADLLPYQDETLKAARDKVSKITSASPGDLPPTDNQRPLNAVLRRKDILELFNTEPDLSGYDIDVSDYIRDSGVPGLQVYWREFDDPNQSQAQTAPDRHELCPISIAQAKGLHKHGAWRWDTLIGRWVKMNREPRPGMTLLLRAIDGGYDSQIGFNIGLDKLPVEIITPENGTTPEVYDEDWRSQQSVPVRLPEHLAHVAEQARQLCEAVGESVKQETIVRAGRWHDLGKAHDVFDATMHRCDKAPEGYLAKSPCRGRHDRKYFRHELASMLAWLDQHDGEEDADLIAYLIVAHHGKVRMSLRAMPTEAAAPDMKRFARGVWEGDVLPALDFDGEHSDTTTLRLALMELGEGEQGHSWTERVQVLLSEHGPFRLAWLETLVRLSDWRASANEQKGEER